MKAIFFSNSTIMATLSILVGLYAMYYKNSAAGQTTLLKKFGEGWENKLLLQFLGIPLILTGFCMFFPDKAWVDVLKILGGVIALFFYNIAEKKWRARKEAAKAEQEAEKNNSNGEIIQSE